MTVVNDKSIIHPRPQDKTGTVEIICGHCGTKVSSIVLAYYQDISSSKQYSWVMCTNCSLGSVVDFEGNTTPNVKFGNKINHIPKDIESAYEEARNCYSTNSHTAVVLLCRKIIMHVAVNKGAEERKSFASYLDYLENNQFITPNIKTWVNHIREKGNIANHSISIANKEESESVLRFTIRLLDLVFTAEKDSNEFGNTQSE